MTLRSPFRGQQLLFALTCSAALAFSAWGQAPAGPAPVGQDLVVLQNGTPQQGKIVGVSGSGLQIQIGAGVISLPLAQIREVRMPVPPELAVAQRALVTRDLPNAQNALRALDKYRGIPTDWAQQVTAMTGDLYVELGQLDKAEAAYKDYQRLYPASTGGPQAEVGIARLAVAKKDFAAAKQKLEPIATRALSEKVIPASMAYTYSQVFLLMGQVKESEGEFTGSLEDYLRTVTVFYNDRAAAAQAQEKADSLRKAHPEVFVN